MVALACCFLGVAKQCGMWHLSLLLAEVTLCGRLRQVCVKLFSAIIQIEPQTRRARRSGEGS